MLAQPVVLPPTYANDSLSNQHNAAGHSTASISFGMIY
jgi:hypothetical protein